MKKTSPTVPQMFSIAEFAARLKVSGKTVSRWIEAGDLHAHRLGRQDRISEEDGYNFIARRRR